MIKLEDVSTRKLIKYVDIERKGDLDFEYIYRLLSMNNITNYQELKNLLKRKKSELQNMVQVENYVVDYESAFKFLYDELLGVVNRIRRANSDGIEVEIFTFDNYKDANLDDKTLIITDKNNNGDVLLYTVPFIRGGARINTLKHLSIAEIKHLLSHVDDYKLQNAFIGMRNFGNETAKRVVDSINFYEQQVLRQAKETDEREIDLFALNKIDKLEIVESEIKEIAEYIVDNASECIWGKLTDTQKKRIMTAALSTRGRYTQNDKWSLIDVISNYTTLNELEQGVVKNKTLNRFIIR